MSAPEGGSVPSSSRALLSRQPEIAHRTPLSSNPVRPEDVALEQYLLRSDTIGSKTSTATTLVDSDQIRNFEPPLLNQAPSNIRCSSASVDFVVADSDTYIARLPRAIPETEVCPSALPLGKDGDHGSGNSSIQTPVTAETAPPWTVLWLKSLFTNIPRKNVIKNFCSLVGCICGIVSTLTYTYRSYMISLWQAEQAFYDHCREWASQPDELGFDLCTVILQEALRQPPYVRYPNAVKPVKRDLPTKQPEWPFETRHPGHFIVCLLLVHGLLFVVYAILILCRRAHRQRRRGPLWDSNALQSPHQGSHHRTDSFTAVDVRIPPQEFSTVAEHLSSTANSGWTDNPLDEKHLASTGHKHGALPGQPEWPCHAIHHASISEPVEQSFTKGPETHGEHLRSAPADHMSAQDDSKATTQSYTPLGKTKTRPPMQVGDALKGWCDDERVLPFFGSENPIGVLRRKVDSQYQRLSARARHQR